MPKRQLKWVSQQPGKQGCFFSFEPFGKKGTS
jgi:hypothetical protein